MAFEGFCFNALRLTLGPRRLGQLRRLAAPSLQDAPFGGGGRAGGGDQGGGIQNEGGSS